MQTAARTTLIALLFEGALGAVALLIGWLVGYWPAEGVGHSIPPQEQLRAAGWGLAAVLPLLVGLFVIEWLPGDSIRQFRDSARRVILQMFGGATWWQLGLVSVAAGFGEELLFRGLVQAGLSHWIGGGLGAGVALIIASILFGLCHWLNATYALLATVAGFYFGLLFAYSSSLWTPVAAHAGYDFVALLYVIRPKPWLRAGV